MALKLSFILPCYNVERYIADCLDSIYTQDIPEEEYEVICVNDCSTDGTRSIIVDYALQHSNLILIDHEQNMNVGETRNTGMKVAKGEYIWFVDPDDMIRPNAAGEAYNIANSDDLDVFFFNNEVVNEKKEFIKNECVFTDCEILSGQEFVVRYFPNRFSGLCIVWRCLFKRMFLRDSGMCFPSMCKGEDVSFLWKVLICASRVKATRNIYYSYRVNPFSIGKRKNEPVAFFSERILFANEIVGMLGTSTLNMQLREDMLKTLYWGANSNTSTLFVMSKEELLKYYGEMELHRNAVDNVKSYMNRKSKLLYSNCGGRYVWVWKVSLMNKLFGKSRL